MRKNWRSKIDKETSVKYTIDYSESKTLSPWAYFGLSVLYAIPVVGTVFLILACIKHKNKNIMSFARGFVLTVIFVIALAIAGYLLYTNNIITDEMLNSLKGMIIK